MRKVLFVANHLTVGGIQKSLISALNSIDYNVNEVTLYIRKNRLDLLPYVNKNVKILINEDNVRYYRLPYALYLQVLIFLCKFFGLKEKTVDLNARLSEYVMFSMFENEKKKYFSDVEYDVAISYWQGYNTLFVDKYINAKRKIMFYQVSTDELHDVHQTTMPNYDSIVVEHEDIKKSLYEWYNGIDGKVFVIENYTNPQLIQEMSSEVEIKKDDRLIFCTCARFSPVKGIDLAVKAANILKDKGYEFLWYFVGDGPTRPEIEKLIDQYKLNDCINLTGMQKNPYPYLGISDVYVQPSYEEALSIAMLEAQILCLPMVSTKTAGGIVMVDEGKTGYLADITPEALAEALEKMITNSEARTEMKNNLSKIDYSSERTRYFNDWCKLLEA